MSRHMPLAIVAGLLLFAPIHLGAQQEPGCRPVDEEAEGLRDYAVQLATEQTPRMDAKRQRYGIVAVPESEVQIVVNDRQLCAAAARKFQREFGDKGKVVRQVYVVRIGDRYLVSDPTARVGEFTAHMVFDKHFKLLASFAG